MHYFVAGVIAASMVLCAGPVVAAESTITIAVFTKNSTNPAYEAFRIAADQVGRANGAQIRHFVPKQPDNVSEQKAMVEQILKQRPDAVGVRDPRDVRTGARRRFSRQGHRRIAADVPELGEAELIRAS